MNVQGFVDALDAWNLRRAASAVALRIKLVAAACALMFTAGAVSAPSQAASLPDDQQQIVDTLTTMFAAVRAEDMDKFNSVLAPGFYIFDGGVRLDAEGIMAVIRAQHEMGKRYEWNVTEPDVHISGDTAWIAYVNKGSISDASGTKQQEWLESALLHRDGKVWKVEFVHSTRVPERAPEKLDWKSGEE